ncbi:hypothetical protein BDP81DRAFT_276905, partial [Colletotrichum phormii]
LGLLRGQEWDSGDPVRDTRSIVGVLCAETIRSFRSVLRSVEHCDDIPQDSQHCLKKACDVLTLWASGYSILEGDLDVALATSWVLQRSMLELLLSIG